MVRSTVVAQDGTYYALADLITNPEAQSQFGIPKSQMLAWARDGTLHKIALVRHRSFLFLRAEVERAACNYHQPIPDEYCTAQEALQLLGNPPSATFAHVLQLYQVRRCSLSCKGKHHSRYAYHRGDIEAAVVKRAQRGNLRRTPPNEQQFTALYEHMVPRVVTSIQRKYRLERETAEDMVQTAFMDMWRLEPDFFDGLVTLDAQARLMYKRITEQVARHFMYEQRQRRDSRKMVRLLDEELERVLPRVPSVEDQVLRREYWSELLERVQRYPPVSRLICKMTLLGYTYQEITDHLEEEYHIHKSDWQLRQVVDAMRHDLAEVA